MCEEIKEARRKKSEETVSPNQSCKLKITQITQNSVYCSSELFIPVSVSETKRLWCNLNILDI